MIPIDKVIEFAREIEPWWSLRTNRKWAAYFATVKHGGACAEPKSPRHFCGSSDAPPSTYHRCTLAGLLYLSLAKMHSGAAFESLAAVVELSKSTCQEASALRDTVMSKFYIEKELPERRAGYGEKIGRDSTPRFEQVIGAIDGTYIPYEVRAGGQKVDADSVPFAPTRRIVKHSRAG
jgi:hypothetical protein